MTRAPIVNGQFYPDNPSELRGLIEKFSPKGSFPLRGCSSKISAKGVVLPHAGYIYSGQVAVTTIGEVLPKKRLLILGPNHTGNGAEFSLWARGTWKILDKEIKIDQELATSILNESGRIHEDTLAHTMEHSVEVQLPILDYFFGDFKFVPIACKKGSLKDYREVSEQIFQAIKKIKNDVLLIASTDLTHYEPDPVARKKDLRAIEAIINLDEEELVKRVRKEDITLCGEAALAIFISCLKMLGAKKSRVALYQTSGDTSGDKSAVVGYVGMIIN